MNTLVSQIVHVILVSNTYSQKRGSASKRIKTTKRSTLKNDTLNTLLNLPVTTKYIKFSLKIVFHNVSLRTFFCYVYSVRNLFCCIRKLSYVFSSVSNFVEHSKQCDKVKSFFNGLLPHDSSFSVKIH